MHCCFRRANSQQLRQKLGESNPETVREWRTEKGAEQNFEAQRCKFLAKKRFYRDEELRVSHMHRFMMSS